MLPEGTILGCLKIDEVFVEYDGPQLFSCSDNREPPQHLLAVHAPATAQVDNWLYVYISAQRLEDVASGKVTLYTAFSQPADGKVHVVSFGLDRAVRVHPVSASELPDNWFPMPEERLGDSDKSTHVLRQEQLPAFLREPAPMWEMSQDVINYLRGMRTPIMEVAKRTGRSVMDVVFKPKGNRSEMPVGTLGFFLLSAQNVVEALAPPAPMGTKSPSTTEFARLDALPAFPGSFGIRLDTHEASLFPNPRLVQSLQRMATLLSSSSDHGAMRRLLEQYGQPGASKFRVFAQALEKSNSDVSIEIGIPNEPAIRVARVTHQELLRLVDFLRSEASSSQETLTFRGQLVGVAIRTKFFALEDDERIISGRIAEAALASMFGTVIGECYDANITVITEVKEATGLERTKYILNSLEHVT